MKTKFQFSLVLVFVFVAFTLAQTHRLYYSVFSKRYKGMEGYYKEMIVTDINKDNIKSYAADYIKYDSINKNSKTGDVFFATPRFVERFSKDLKSGITTNYEANLNDVFSYETQDEIKWELHQESKEISGYKTQKATTTFGGRNWVAWFAKDLDIPYGPYKFYGLPGLILEIQDENKEYIFQFLQNKVLDEVYDTSNFLETYYGKTPIKLSIKNIHKLKMNYYLDPFKEFKAGKRPNEHLGEVGERINYNAETLEIQKRLRAENPIDLKNAVKYPEK